MQQLILPIISDKDSYNTSDFIVAYSNLEAYRAITTNITWPQNRLLIIGENGSGKTHLTKIWQQKHCAQYINLPTNFNMYSNTTCFILENIEHYHELDILRAINLAFENNYKLLLTCSYYNHFWLQDLKSRLNATYKVLIKNPDEYLTQILVSKMLHDKQIKVNKEILEYVAFRIKRSFFYIKTFVEYLARISLEQKRAINMVLIKEVMNNLKTEESNE